MILSAVPREEWAQVRNKCSAMDALAGRRKEWGLHRNWVGNYLVEVWLFSILYHFFVFLYNELSYFEYNDCEVLILERFQNKHACSCIQEFTFDTGQYMRNIIACTCVVLPNPQFLHCSLRRQKMLTH